MFGVAETLAKYGDLLLKSVTAEELEKVYGPLFVAWYERRHFMARKVEILEKTGTPYSLVRRLDATYQPFVVVINFDENSGTWGQGHYFCEEEDARNYLAWKVREVVKTTHKTKLFRTKTLKEESWDGTKVKYRWYKRTFTNCYGSWVEHIFTYDGTDTDYSDWECDSEKEAQEWFDSYGKD